jgi:ribosomal protein S30
MDSRRYGSSVDLHDRDRDDDDPIVRLTEENVKLRRKLKELNYRLDDELEKAAKDRFKTPKIETKHADNSGNELKNAYRIIDRLQKSIKHYESNEGYNSSMTKIMDLEDVIKKKEKEIEELRVELKTQKKINKEQEKHIDELNEASKKVVNPAQDKE